MGYMTLLLVLQDARGVLKIMKICKNDYIPNGSSKNSLINDRFTFCTIKLGNRNKTQSLKIISYLRNKRFGNRNKIICKTGNI